MTVVSTFISFTVPGIVIGAVYGVTAIGLVVTYNTTGVFNFAQGAVGMVAAYLVLGVVAERPLAVPARHRVHRLLVEAPLLALVVEFVLFRRLHGATVERSLMVSLGLPGALLGVATIFWSAPTIIRSSRPINTQSNDLLSVRLFGANGSRSSTNRS